MKKFFQFAALLIFGCALTGCSGDETPGFGSIYGLVTNANTGQPVYGATVTLSPGNFSTTTGSDGRYEFVDLEPGQYKIQVQATDYQANSSQIQVNAGSQAIGDIAITPVGEITGIQLSTSVMNFDTNYSELTFTLRNIGNTGTVSWYISGINVSWLTISPQQGETAMGKSSEIKVMIDRSNITSSQSTSFIVNAAGGSQSIVVLVSTESDGGGNEGDDEGEGGDTSEDYSSATITSCDYRVDAEIVSCKWSGSSVVFTYTLTNNGLGDVNDWRIVPPSSMSVIQGGTRSLITDSEGNEYPYPTMTFRTASTTDSQYNMSDSKVTFKNVPIY